jgi:hypothetical protein
MEHDQQPQTVFSKRGAALGFVAYIVIIVIVVVIFRVG